ncbi:hypothetical protein TIFTF001_007268 [Ficus carica]|uniref:Uncharacterized protein n=1 Tax=Ficus carica TaxID=3494 RepID=A0AA88D1U6_FICCA|nr:hypothetical protein TIFTF001_007268 [Ficus carica]
MFDTIPRNLPFGETEEEGQERQKILERDREEKRSLAASIWSSRRRGFGYHRIWSSSKDEVSSQIAAIGRDREAKERERATRRRRQMSQREGESRIYSPPVVITKGEEIEGHHVGDRGLPPTISALLRRPGDGGRRENGRESDNKRRRESD